MIKAIALSFFLFLLITAQSQNLTGTWEGSSSDGAEYWRISIIHIGDSCYGYSYDEGPGFCKENFAASFNKKENKFKGQGIDFISHSADHILIAATLRYIKDRDGEYLEGTVRAKSLAAQIFSFGIAADGVLRKISNDVDSTPFIKSTVRRLNADKNIAGIKNETIKKDSVAITKTKRINDSSVSKKIFEDSVTLIKNSRPTVITKTISTNADSVKIILYDDGEIDGDIVTIFDNGKIMVNKLTLSKEPYEITLALPSNNSKHIIELMAENEGSIPPNTAYMLVLAGRERVEVKASSDKKSNAAIVIQKSN